MRRSLAFLAAIGFTLSTAVQIATFFGIDPTMRWPVLAPGLLLPATLMGAGGAFLPTLASGPPTLFRRGGADELFSRQMRGEALAYLERGLTRPGNEDDLAKVVRRFRAPPEAIGLGLLALYLIASVTVSAVLLRGGQPELISSGYGLVYKGKIIEHLSEGEYVWMRAHLTRLFSCFSMLLFALAKVGWGLPDWVLRGTDPTK